MTGISDERRAHIHRAVDRAKAVLKPGDRIRATRCGGGSPTFTFEAWDGPVLEGVQTARWIVTRSGIDDVSPFSIIAVNGVPTSFRDDPAAHIANPFDDPRLTP